MVRIKLSDCENLTEFSSEYEIYLVRTLRYWIINF